jgi:hypothetical protein
MFPPARFAINVGCGVEQNADELDQHRYRKHAHENGHQIKKIQSVTQSFDLEGQQTAVNIVSDSKPEAAK